MKVILAVMLLAASLYAQQSSSRVAPACGPKTENFDVTLNDSQHTMAHPEQGKARVYFVHDDGTMGKHQHYTLRIGLNGAWIGAYKHNSYFTVSVEPGEYHVCANVQSNSSFGNLLELAHFTAEAGKTYYFRTRFIAGMTSLYPIPPYLNLDPVDSDQAKYLIEAYPLSASTKGK